MMDDDDDDSKHRRLFHGWLNDNLKTNSSLISKDTYDEIVNFLLKKQNGENLEGFPRCLKRRVSSRKFRLMSYPPIANEHKK